MNLKKRTTKILKKHKRKDMLISELSVAELDALRRLFLEKIKPHTTGG